MGKKRVVIYGRIAGAAQEMMRTDEFLLKRFSGLLEQHPEWEIDNIYRDVQQSYQPASTRPALNQLLLDCRKGLIDAVLVRSASDISRDITEVKDIVDQLNNLPNSVPVFFWRERISSISNDFQLLLSFVEPIAQECNLWIKEDPSIARKSQKNSNGLD